MPQKTPFIYKNEQENESLPALQHLCRSVLQSAFPAFREGKIDACFYPYIGLTHTMRRRGSSWVIRISDHCRKAPRPVLEAIVRILACKVMHRKPHLKYLEIYAGFRNDPSIIEAVRERRLLRGRKRLAVGTGICHSLEDIYREVNSRYFNNQADIEKIGWGMRKSWNRLGHYDPVHHTIIISPALDAPDVPDFVVRYIVYHEMLHSIFEDTLSRSKNRHHPSGFRRAERAYPDFARAKKFLREYCGRRRCCS
jgi:hypothetical protein